MTSNTLAATGKIDVSVKLINTGDYDGEEVVQLYIRDLAGSVTRPVRELKGFRKVHLRKGESATVTFTVDEPMLRFYNSELKFVSEPGDFKVFIGGNSRDVLEADFTLGD